VNQVSFGFHGLQKAAFGLMDSTLFPSKRGVHRKYRKFGDGSWQMGDWKAEGEGPDLAGGFFRQNRKKLLAEVRQAK
jgi:hypothetical protein